MASRKERLKFSELRPSKYQVLYRTGEGDPLAEARTMADQRLEQIVGTGKADSREKARALLALMNEFSDAVCTLARRYLGLARIIKDDEWEVQQGLWRRLFTPLSYANQVPWVGTDFLGFGTPVEKGGLEANKSKDSGGIKRIYRYSTSISSFNINCEKRAYTPCLFECLSYGSKEAERHPRSMMTLLTATTPLDDATPATIRLVSFYAISSDPFHSEVATTYNEAGRGSRYYIGMAGETLAGRYREIFKQFGFVPEDEVPKNIDFESVWQTFLRNAGSQTFVHPIEYLA